MSPEGGRVSSSGPSNLKRKSPASSSLESSRQQTIRAKRIKTSIARTVVTQSTDASLNNGEMNLHSFLKSREFELKALENNRKSSKDILNLRAFQQLPRDMRRRTASHNVKKIPQRLQNKARREQAQDNTPTVKTSKRKPGSSRGRIRAETAKRLGILAAKKRNAKDSKAVGHISTRTPIPKLQNNKLNVPPKPKPKYRKRQLHKTWLPTHLWHAKRANMTEPKKPLWRFAMPLRCTEKSYRPTHRASGVRGAVAWDTSYMSTIGLEGSRDGLEKVLKSLGVTGKKLWEEQGDNWRSGKRSWTGWLSRGQGTEQLSQIGPSTIVWCSPRPEATCDVYGVTAKKQPFRQLFVRIHPSIFLETWTEVLRLSKLQRPAVRATDLRFEVGSIEIIGPGSTESLLGVLHPFPESEGYNDGHGKAFTSLAGVTNPASLPLNALLSFTVKDPRLQYPPRPVPLPKPTDETASFSLLETLSAWPVDAAFPIPALFDKDARFKATRLPSQKAINRRKSLVVPGAYPTLIPSDPKIPIMLIASRVSGTSAQGSWTILAPWKCIVPIWYGLVHYPLSSGGNPRFGGLRESRQTQFEHGMPWFPADYPGTAAGQSWEAVEREKRKAEWERKPKSKRVEWNSLDLGAKRKGEIGLGWACDFEKLLEINETYDHTKIVEMEASTTKSTEPSIIEHLPTESFTALLSSATTEIPRPTHVATIRLELVSRGVATPCARIYRLPAPVSVSMQEATASTKLGATREQWISLLPSPSHKSKIPAPHSKAYRQQGRIPVNTPLPQRVRLLAQSLLEKPPPQNLAAAEEDGHLLVPGEEDLIGFVTTGEFSLAEGKGIAIGPLLVARTVEGVRRGGSGAKEGRLCIVRNSGEKIGRLARWEPV